MKSGSNWFIHTPESRYSKTTQLNQRLTGILAIPSEPHARRRGWELIELMVKWLAGHHSPSSDLKGEGLAPVNFNYVGGHRWVKSH